MNKQIFKSILILLSIALSLCIFISRVSKTNQKTNININEVPYISTYYINPIISPNEDVIIDFYVTDFSRSEYTSDDYSNKFTITIKIDGKKSIVKKNVKAGDNSINIGKFSSLGEQNFSIYCTDEYGRRSHELFNTFLVKNKETAKEYFMTKNDLTKYNIKDTDKYEKIQYEKIAIENPDSSTVKNFLQNIAEKTIVPPNSYVCITADPSDGNWPDETVVKYSTDYDKDYVLTESINTRKGLQKLINDKKNEGYTSIKLLEGTYRIDHLEPISIPSEFTLDLNNSTIKLNGFAGNKSLMIILLNTFNSHVINGIIEGDYYSHDYSNSDNKSEWINGISMNGNCRYSSFENLIVKNITGYGACNGIGKINFSSPYEYTYIDPINISNTFQLKDIDTSTGAEIDSTTRTTSNYIDITGYNKLGYLTISKYLGYQGNDCGTWNIICHFYDKDKNFIESISGYQYRKVKVPEDAQYLKVTILNEAYPTDLSIQLFAIPINCSFNNIKFENCRAVGMAQGAMNNMLVENCEFTNCGQKLASCAYDAEDGWDQMQDVTFRKLNFHDNPHNDFLTCAGHNFIIENLINGNLYIWERSNSYVIRNNNNINKVTLGYSTKLRSGYSRFYDNIVKYGISIKDSKNTTNDKIIIKNCYIQGRAESEIGSSYFINCDISNDLFSTPEKSPGIGVGNFINCTISNINSTNINGGFYSNCTLSNISGNILGNFNMNNCTINNLNCFCAGDESSYTFEDCQMDNFQLQFNYWYLGANILIKNCTINNSNYLLKLPHYSLKKSINLINNNINSKSSNGLIYLFDDREFIKYSNSFESATINLNNNTIELTNSKYIITGLNENTLNKINITSKNNHYNSSIIELCNPECKVSLNIKIKEEE